MRRPALVLVVLLAAAAFPRGDGQAARRHRDQKPTMFSDPRFAWLKITKVRTVVSWRVNEKGYWERAWVDKWLAAAKKANAQPLIGSVTPGPAPSAGCSRASPSRREVREFHRRYPWCATHRVERGNHCSQPTCHRPDRARAVLRRARLGLPQVQRGRADVIDQPNMERWLRAFRRAARHRSGSGACTTTSTSTACAAAGTGGSEGHPRRPGLGHRDRRLGAAQALQEPGRRFEESEAHAAKAIKFACSSACATRSSRGSTCTSGTPTPRNQWDSG